MIENTYKIKLRKGDNVIVLTGKDKGKTGKVVTTHPKTNKVTVENINVVKRHLKPNRQHPQGGIIDINKPINVSNIAIVEPTSKKPSKISYETDTKTGKRIRVYKRSGKEIK